MNDFIKKIAEQNLLLVPLHNYPEYREQCMIILNKEWPRSETLRYRAFDSSRDELPTSLVFVERNNAEDKVVGHSKLNIIPNDVETVWIESVIIHHDYRGKGYGRVLMELTEEYAYSLGYKYAALSTHGEEKFYEKLGYEFSQPICLYGGPINQLFLPNSLMSCNINSTAKDINNEDINNSNRTLEVNNISASSSSVLKSDASNFQKSHISVTSQYSTPISCNENIIESGNIPLPPPLPQYSSYNKQEKLKITDIQKIDGKNKKLYMRKQISYGAHYSQV